MKIDQVPSSDPVTLAETNCIAFDSPKDPRTRRCDNQDHLGGALRKVSHYGIVRHRRPSQLNINLLSELHAYRGHVKSPPGYITGHEGAGFVKEIGSGVKNFKVGDYIVTPFTSACMECFYCKAGCSGRCEKCQLLGSPGLGGTQAEYFRMPLADSTLFKAPEELGEELVLMSDIYPTGWAKQHLLSSQRPPD